MFKQPHSHSFQSFGLSRFASVIWTTSNKYGARQFDVYGLHHTLKQATELLMSDIDLINLYEIKPLKYYLVLVLANII